MNLMDLFTQFFNGLSNISNWFWNTDINILDYTFKPYSLLFTASGISILLIFIVKGLVK